MFLSTINVPIPPRRSINMLLRLMDLEESDEHRAEVAKWFRADDIRNTDFTGLSLVQVFFRFEAARIAGIDDLDELLDALGALDDDKRRRLIEVLEDDTVRLAYLLIGSSWWKDVSRNALNIQKALTTFRKAADLGNIWFSPSLGRASYVAMAVLHDDYNNAPIAALAVLDEATETFGAADPYLLKQRAMVLFHLTKDEEAVALFDQALAGEGLDNVERAFAGRTGGIAAARIDDWSSAERFFLMGASAAEEIADLRIMAAGLKADAAFARWKQGRYSGALCLYVKVLELLEEIPSDDDLQTRYVHATVRYCLGWLDMSPTDRSETRLAEPPPGVCSSSNPHEGLTDDSIIDLAILWSLLGNIDTRLGTGIDLTRKAEKKSNGALPLMVRFWERIARYEALSNGNDLPRAVSIVIGLIEGSVYVKQINAARHEYSALNGITPLSQDYWREQTYRADLLFCLIAVGVWATCLTPERSLPIHEWLNDAHLHDVAGPEVDRFFALLTGTERRADGSLLEEAAMALRRIREDTLPPNDLFICHFRLLNALSSGEWGKPAGDALAKIVSAQWVNACQHQRFALTTPSLYAPLLRDKCEDVGRSGFSMVASILKTAAVATGVGLADSGIEFLSRMERGEGNPPSTA